MTYAAGRARAAAALGVVLALASTGFAHAAAAPAPRTLRVCADPDNLPFSNRAEAGFENAIVERVAHALGARVEYTWWSQRRGFARNTLGAGVCDLWPGVASAVETMATTAPYYRSSYVFVSRRDANLDVASFDDPRLRTLRIGVQMIGNDATNTPPAHALARRGITTNVRGFMIYGADGRESQSPIVDAVADGSVDLAIVWGPAAGYYARRAKTPLRLVPTPAADGPAWPMAFDISMGVRKGDAALKAEIDAALATERPAIDRILADYGVPRATDAAVASRGD
ncbi:MAG TPA: quinoprotein dehydrogenase-associated putative ABC transporter substrate-binding protein [Dokdonella sp.]